MSIKAIPIPDALWVDAFAISGILSGSPIEIQNIGNSPIRYSISASPTPPLLSDENSYNILRIHEKLDLPYGLDYVWLIGSNNGSIASINKSVTATSITQSYLESNTKLGNAFKFSARKINVAAGAQLDFGIETGAYPVIVKARYLNQLGSTEVTYSAFEDSVYTGGTAVQTRNQSRITPRASLFSVVLDPTVTNIGTQYLPDFSILASGTNASSRLGTDAVGDETNLKPNTKHIFRARVVTNPATVLYLGLLVYEGPLDYPYTY